MLFDGDYGDSNGDNIGGDDDDHDDDDADVI